MDKKGVFIIFIVLLSLVSLSYVYGHSPHTGDCHSSWAGVCRCASGSACEGPGGWFGTCSSSYSHSCASGYSCVGSGFLGSGSCQRQRVLDVGVGRDLVGRDFGDVAAVGHTGDCPLAEPDDPFAESYVCGCASETACSQYGLVPGGTFWGCVGGDNSLPCAAGHVCVDDGDNINGECVAGELDFEGPCGNVNDDWNCGGSDRCVLNYVGGALEPDQINVCSDDHYCYRNETSLSVDCLQKKDSGQPCTDNYECLSDDCSGDLCVDEGPGFVECGLAGDGWLCSDDGTRCVSFPEGAPEAEQVCDENSYCFASEELLSVVGCVAKRTSGESCSNNYECLSGLCNEGICTEAEVPPLEPGCDSDDDCLGEATCSPGGDCLVCSDLICEVCGQVEFGGSFYWDCNNNDQPDSLCPDTVCSEGQSCDEESGTCVVSEACTSDDDCTGEVCRSGSCTEVACDSSEEDCEDDEACFGDSEGSGECAPCEEEDDEDDDDLICHDDPCVGNDDPEADCNAAGTGRSCSSLNGRTCNTNCIGGTSPLTSRQANCWVPSTCTCEGAPQYVAALGTSVRFDRQCKAGSTCLSEVRVKYTNGTDVPVTEFSSIGLTQNSNPYNEQDAGCCGIDLEQQANQDRAVPGYGLIALMISGLIIGLYYIRKINRKLLKS